jgi:hypothetical protein
VAETALEIYKHMSQVHRTWYAVAGVEDFDFEEGEYEDEDTEDELEWEGEFTRDGKRVRSDEVGEWRAECWGMDWRIERR